MVKAATDEVIFTSSSGAQKGRKPERLSLLPPKALKAIARVFDYGSKKYADHNFRKGYAWSWSIDAMLRHILAFIDGEDLDLESGQSHIAHAGFHCLALLEFMQSHPEFDDRYKAEKLEPHK